MTFSYLYYNSSGICHSSCLHYSIQSQWFSSVTSAHLDSAMEWYRKQNLFHHISRFCNKVIVDKTSAITVTHWNCPGGVFQTNSTLKNLNHKDVIFPKSHSNLNGTRPRQRQECGPSSWSDCRSSPLFTPRIWSFPGAGKSTWTNRKEKYFGQACKPQALKYCRSLMPMIVKTWNSFI